MWRNKCLFIPLVFFLIMAVCGCSFNTPAVSGTDAASTATEQSIVKNGNGNQHYDPKNVKHVSFQIVREAYIEKNARINATIHYPQIILLGDRDRQNRINEILKKDALKVLNRPEDDDRLLTLPIDYQITWQSENLLSVQYRGLSRIEKGAYPMHLFYTTNINVAKGCKLRLPDMIIVNENFVVKFRDRKLKSLRTIQLDGEYIFAGRGLEVKPVSDTIRSFDTADMVYEEGWFSTIYSYFTPDSLGISVGVSHAIGDHLEFEIKYQDIADNIKAENEAWKDFFPIKEQGER